MSAREWLAVGKTQECKDVLRAARIRFREMRICSVAKETCSGASGDFFGFRSTPSNREKFLAALKSGPQDIVMIDEVSARVHEGWAAHEKVTILNIQKFRHSNTEENCQAYLAGCSQFLNAETRKSEANINELESRVGALRRDLTSKIQMLNTEKSHFAYLQREVVPEQTTRFRQNFEGLIKTPHVRGMNVDATKISVLTDRIYIDRGGRFRKRDIGDFRIDVYFEGKLKFKNLTRLIENRYEHPHIESGEVQLGNLSEALPRLAADYQFAAVVTLAIKFLQSYNASSAWRKIELWPTAKKEAAKEVKKE